MDESLELIHWAGTVILVATLVVQILPTPGEIESKAYLVLYNTVRRIASLKIDAAWKEQVLIPKKTETELKVKTTETVGERRDEPEEKKED